jgi:hypothetical protein
VVRPVQFGELEPKSNPIRLRRQRLLSCGQQSTPAYSNSRAGVSKSLCPDLEQQFHIDDVQPASEFIADLFEVADGFEPERAVQSNARFVAPINRS